MRRKVALIFCILCSCITATAQETEPKIPADVERHVRENTCMARIICQDVNKQSAVYIGSGFTVGYPRGNRQEIVSVFHNIDKAFSRIPDPTCEVWMGSRKARVEFFDESKDLLLFSVKARDKTPGLIVRRSTRLGEKVFVVGNPFGQEGVLLTGEVSGAFAKLTFVKGEGLFTLVEYVVMPDPITTGVVEISTSAAPGYSGAAISLVADGSAIGIISGSNFWGAQGATGEEVLEFLDRAHAYQRQGELARRRYRESLHSRKTHR